jgi:flagellar L-ring protein FlgH
MNTGSKGMLLVLGLGLAASVAQAQNSSLYAQAQAELQTKAMEQPNTPAAPVRSLIAAPKPEPKTFAKQQLITIIINEQASHSSTDKVSTDRKSSVDAQVAQWISLHSSGNTVGAAALSNGQPAIQADADRKYDGTGSAARTDTLQARITGKIIDIKPNGNLVIEASKSITTEEESYTIAVTGSCRTEDVTPDNTILSTQIAELEITKTASGALKDATKRGWFHRIADCLNIF